MRRIIDHSLRSARVTARSGAAGRFLVFSAVGVVGTAAHYLVLIVLHEFLGVNAVIASAMGFVVGALVNYLLNYHVTFRSEASHGLAILKFYAIATIGFVLNVVVIWFMLHWFEAHYIVSQVLATCVVLVWGYLGNSSWTFSETKGAAAGSGRNGSSEKNTDS